MGRDAQCPMKKRMSADLKERIKDSAWIEDVVGFHVMIVIGVYHGVSIRTVKHLH